MRKEINDLIRNELLKIDEADTAGSYDRYVHVLHEDGSEYKIMHSRVERRTIRDIELIVVFCEHNTVNVFVSMDLEWVKIKPWKGRETKLKLNKSVPQLKL